VKTHQSKISQSGFSLLEVLVSSIIGSIAIAGIMTFFINTMQSNSDGLKEIRLNQELRALLDVMVRDIRRSGYWRNADGVTYNIYANDENALKVSSNGNCITYSYDNFKINDSKADIVQNSDAAGFRLINNTIKIRRNSSTCDSSRNWESLSDVSAINITALNFKITPVCINISSPILPTNIQRGCKADGGPGNLLAREANDTLATINKVTIKLSGELASDPSVSAMDIIEIVTVRNSILL